MNRRASGLLMHLTSLPGRHGIGDLGDAAYDFADFLVRAGQTYWQILPLNITDLGSLNSPYNSISAFAGNVLLISLDRLAKDGLLDPGELAPAPDFPAGRVDFPAVTAYKLPLLHRAAERFACQEHLGFQGFCQANRHWLDDFTLFKVLSARLGGPWNAWPAELRDREPWALKRARAELAPEITREAVLQFFFFRQWMALRQHLYDRQLQVLGDLPIYVDYHSADVWAHPGIFKLDHDKNPIFVSGVPPDYFSATGQRWGNPVYDWPALKARNYDWWLMRMEHNLRLVDYVRVDHFRGLAAYWEVPAAEESAINGRWVQAPARDFFRAMLRRFPFLPLVAEDLGIIDAEVREIKAMFGLPGMKLLLFAFGERSPDNPYLPHNYEKDCIAYTGTHDNNTVRAWFEGELGHESREWLFAYLGRRPTPEELPWELIRLIMASVADTAIVPVQDLLGLGGEARMNVPSQRAGNWGWRLVPGLLDEALAVRLLGITTMYGRV